MSVKHGKISDADAAPDAPNHARWVLETLVEDEATWRHSHGLEVSGEALRAEWRRVLERQEARGPQTRAAPAREGPSARAERLAESLGYRFVRLDPETATARPRAAPTELERRLHQRIARLCRLVPNLSGKPEPEFPAELANIFRLHERLRYRRGEFTGLNARDANRCVVRQLMDIADGSNRLLGEWRNA